MLALAHTKAASRSLGHTAMMDEHGKSDRSVVPPKRPNNAPERAAEVVEGRERTKGNAPERNAPRTQGRAGAPSTLERVRQAAKQDRKQRFTALLHHVYDVEHLRAAWRPPSGERRRPVEADVKTTGAGFRRSAGGSTPRAPAWPRQ